MLQIVSFTVHHGTEDKMTPYWIKHGSSLQSQQSPHSLEEQIIKIINEKAEKIFQDKREWINRIQNRT